MSTSSSRLARAAFAMSLFCGLTLAASAQQWPSSITPFNYDDTNPGHDHGLKVAVAPDGSIFVAGTGHSHMTGDDFVLVKYKQNGTGQLTKVWQRFYNGPVSGDDELNGLAVDTSGNAYVCGTSPGGATGKDAAVIGWDANGFPLWNTPDRAVRYDSGGGQDDFGTGITLVVNWEGVAICGYTSPGQGLVSAFALVVNSDGTVRSGWPQTYGGGSNSARFNAIASDGSNLFAVGHVSGIFGPNSILFQRFSVDGALTQNATYSYLGLGDDANAVTYAANGTGGNDRIALTGFVTSSLGQQLVILAYDATGLVWSKVFGVDQNLQALSLGRSIAYSPDGYVYATGSVVLSTKTAFLTVKLEQASGGLVFYVAAIRDRWPGLPGSGGQRRCPEEQPRLRHQAGRLERLCDRDRKGHELRPQSRSRRRILIHPGPPDSVLSDDAVQQGRDDSNRVPELLSFLPAAGGSGQLSG